MKRLLSATLLLVVLALATISSTFALPLSQEGGETQPPQEENEAAGAQSPDGPILLGVIENREVAIADVPTDVRSMLPTTESLLAALAGDLDGSGRISWALLHTTRGAAVKNGTVTILGGTEGSWNVDAEFQFEEIARPELAFANLPPGPPAIALIGNQGTHGMILLVAKWTGAEYSEFLRINSNSTIRFEDVDSDGLPEAIVYQSPYCQSYAASPKVVSVGRWTDGNFYEATARYQDLLMETQLDANSIWVKAQKDPKWNQDDKACLNKVMEYLSKISDRWGKVADYSSTAGARVYPAPSYPRDNRLYKLNSGALQISTTQGRSWEQVAPITLNLAYTDTTRIRLSPTFDRDNTIVAMSKVSDSHVVGDPYEFAISRNAGQSWETVKVPVKDFKEWQALYPVEKNSESRVIISPTFADDGQMWFIGTGAIYATKDGGKSWGLMPVPVPGATITSFAASGAAGGSQVLLMGLNDRTRTPSARFVRSLDKGATWIEFTDALRDPKTLAVPAVDLLAGASPVTLYAAHPKDNITYYSTDLGASWQTFDKKVKSEEVAGDGTLILMYTNMIEAFKPGSEKQYGYMPPEKTVTIRSVASLTTHGYVLVELADGLWAYRVR